MKRTSFLFTAALVGQAALFAQTPVGANAFQSADMLNAGRGGRGGGGSSLPVPRAETGKPFSATATTQTVQTYADGTRISQSTSMVQYRDAEGRVRTETTAPGGPNAEPVKSIVIRDPVAGATYMLDPGKRTALTVPGPGTAIGAASPGAGARGGAPGGRGPGQPGGARGSGGVDTYADSVPALVQQFSNRISSEPAEDLGMQTINGVLARGTRITTVIPQGAIGNDREFRSISERWFSPDLNLLIRSVSTDPRFGTTTFELSNISRQSPDPSLFRVPADYTTAQPNIRRQ
jgi:hypothetical protein